MTTTTKLLSYGSLQSVIRFMDANLRFHLYKSIPSIRTAEKSVPLQVDFLGLSKTKLTINTTSYKLGIYRKHTTETPEYIKTENHTGGLPYDVDQYGCWDFHREFEMETGDIQLFEENEKGALLRQEVPREYLEKKVWEYKKRKNVDELLKQFETELSFRNCNRDGVLPPYKFYIQATLSFENPTRTYVERVEYSKTLSQVYKKLVQDFLCRSGNKIRVKDLKLKSKLYILRWPHGLCMKVKNVMVYNPKSLEYLQPILDSASYPLQLLRLKRYSDEVSEAIMEVMQRAKCVEVHGFLSREMFQSLRTTCLTRFVLKGTELSSNDLVNFVEEWINNPPPVGTIWVFKEFHLWKDGYEFYVSKVLSTLADNYEKYTGNGRVGRIPITDNTMIVVGFEHDDASDTEMMFMKIVSTDQEVLS